MYVTEWGNYSKKITDLFENEKSGGNENDQKSFYGNVRKNVIRCFF